MNFKSVLCAATMLAAAGVAQAFPDYTLYPADGATLDSNQYFESVNFSIQGGNAVISDGAYATLESVDDGDEVESISFDEFMLPGNVLIKFDSSEILVNGQWKLTIPEGSLTVDGEKNPEITAYYTLNDPNLGLGEFPQIDLVSIDPAAGSKLAYWGGSVFKEVDIDGENRRVVTIKTSDDAAVNYIEWFLYDTTNGEEEGVAEYIAQGKDNRYDRNRFHDYRGDIWANGLFIVVPDDDVAHKLILGHTYRLDLRFCGIGYDDATNQYPTPQQLNMSTELETSVLYEGLIPAPEYAAATVLEVSPNPDGYKIETPEQGVFHITYSAPVKPVAFTYPLGSGAGLANAGTWAPFQDMEADENGLCTVWTFTISESALESAAGAITVNVQAQDKDGLYVKGNADMTFDDYNYSITWQCNIAAPALVSVSPAENSTVESLSSITVSNEKNGMTRVMTCYDGINTPARILTMEGEEVRILERPTFSDDEMQATFTFEPITANGTYILQIPEWYFNLGEEMDAFISNSAAFRYYVENGETPSKVSYDLLPAEVDPANDAVVESISTVKLTFGNVTYTPLEDTPEAKLYKVVDGEDSFIEGVVAVDNDFFNPTAYTYSFTEVTEAGQYKVVIPKATFFDGSYDESAGEAGHASPEIVLNYTIEGGNTPSNVEYTLVPVAVSPEDGASVDEIRMVTVTFDQTAYCTLDGTGPMAQLYKVEEDGDKLVGSADPIDNWESDYFNPTIYDFYFEAIEAGNYKVVIPQGTFFDGAYDESNGTSGRANPELVYYYTVIELPAPEFTIVPLDVTPENCSAVKELDVVTLTFDEVVIPAQIAKDFAVDFATAEIYRVTENGDELIDSVVPTDNPASNYLEPKIYDIKISPAIDEIGAYKVVLPEGAFGTFEYVDSYQRTGKASAEIILYYAIGAVGVDAIFGSDAVINVYDVNGVQVIKNADVEAAKALKSGLYIINGKKVMIRR